MSEEFVIPLNGLSAGKNEFRWQASKEFFETFENSEILDAQLDASVSVEKSGRYIGVDCEVVGTVTVECDRCLGDLKMPVDEEILLSVKFGEEGTSEETDDSEREVIYLPQDDAVLDMKQIIYDYVCLALPMQRIHDEGDCDPDALKHLSAGESVEAEADENNPFSALKDMFK
jgi:uncharacterized metal-binding protein YceD (DUF177 family)